jgi:tetraacyldisaccharide 4'-kinase
MKYSPPFPISRAPSVLLEEILHQQRKGLIASLVRTLLYLPSLLFGLTIKLRNFSYNHSLFKQYKADACVISIGNIVAGGTGKTPFILMLAKKLSVSCKVAILSRGYGSKAEKMGPQLVTLGKTAQDVGDEPLLLANQIPEAMVIVGKDRVQSAKMAVELGAEVILLDDGMQHRRLYRDFEIVISGAYKNGRYLPGGMLRDDPKRIDQADLIVTSTPKERNEVGVQTILKEFRFASGEKKRTLGKSKVALFCGLGSPHRFLKSIEDEGLEIVMAQFLSDHQMISLQNLKQFAHEAKKRGAELLLCTEKDWMKLRDQRELELELPLAWTSVECTVMKNQEALDALIEKVLSRVL